MRIKKKKPDDSLLKQRPTPKEIFFFCALLAGDEALAPSMVEELGKKGLTRLPDELLLDFWARGYGYETRQELVAILGALVAGATFGEAAAYAKQKS